MFNSHLKAYALSLLSLFCHLAVAQIPTSNFSVPNTACLNETLDLLNQSQNTVSYVWDFCQQDLSTTPVATTSVSMPLAGSNQFNAIQVIYDSGEWVGFASNRAAAKLYRLEFGNNLQSAPSIIDLGDQGVLTYPGAMDFIKQGNIWFAIVANVYSNNIVLFEFGNGLKSQPTSVQILTGTGALNTPFGVRIVNSNGTILVFVTNNGSNSIQVINFGNSIQNSPISTKQIGGSVLNSPEGLSILQDESNSNWYGIVNSTGNGTVYHMDFGADPYADPVFTNVGSIPNGTDIQLIKEGLNYFAFSRSLNNGIYRISFGQSLSNITPITTNLGLLGVPLDLSLNIFIVKDSPGWVGFTIDFFTGTIWRFKFLADCSQNVSANYSKVFQPGNIFYKNPGSYFIELSATNSFGVRDISSAVVTVSSIQATQVSALVDNSRCSSVANSFSVTSSIPISTYDWDFGDNTPHSSGSTPQHQFSQGNYDVVVRVTDQNGCNNLTRDTINIYNPPTASFTLPPASPFCTNQNYVFSNTTTSDPGSNPSWQWSVNGTNTATTQDLNYLIPTTTAQSVTLMASIPGCSSQSTQNISSVLVGPLVVFGSPTTGCVNSSIQFTNNTSGSINSLSWTFGDGNTSLQPNPTNTYTNTGNFQVTLSVSNTSGCQNFATKSFPVYSVPQPDFAIEAPPFSCAKYPSQFDNNTPALVDSNITTWAWDFGDGANAPSANQNPAYTFAAAGNYNVTLQATSNFGCTQSKQKSITILPSPQAGFTNTPACVNQYTQFTNASSGTIASYQWSIQGNSIAGTSPLLYIFKSPGSYPVTLAVTGSNNCKSQVVQTLTVPVLPVMDFTVQAPCTGHPSVLQEVNPGGPDPSVAWNWNFGGVSGIGSPVSYQFPSVGGYPVTLSATRQSGCVYSVSKNVSIGVGPVASFTPSVQAGASPLVVTFNNTSTADYYIWQFGDADNTTTRDMSPTFTYTQLGEYKALLTANTIAGCSDTLSSKISVVVPHLDAIMKNFTLTNDPSTNSSKAQVTILNSGNMPLTNPEVDIDLGGSATLKANVTGVLQPGKSIVQILSVEIVPQLLGYVCAEVIVANDADTANDKQCLTLSSEDVIFSPYPNPATAIVNFDWVSSTTENVSITIYKSNGEVISEQNILNVPAGLGQISLNTSSFSGGLYFIRFSGSKTQKTFRVMVAN